VLKMHVIIKKFTSSAFAPDKGQRCGKTLPRRRHHGKQRLRLALFLILTVSCSYSIRLFHPQVQSCKTEAESVLIRSRHKLL
jgi:hypothetical protein